MKKTVMFLGMLSVGYAYAQQGRVGINTTEPKATLHIEKKIVNNNAQGVIFPELTTTERDNNTNGLQVGTVIFNKTKQCLEIYAGNPAQWSCIVTVAAGGNGGGGNVPGQGTIPSTLTLKSNSHFIASTYDDNYLPYTAPTGPATLGTYDPDSQTETLINIPGVIPANGVAVQIPITATGSGTLTSSTFEATIAAEHTKGTGNTNGGTIPRKVMLTWSNTTFNSTDTYITAFIKPTDGQEIQLRRLDLNNGIGNDGKGIEIAKFTYNANTNGSQQATFKLHIIAGIPDKKFGVQTNGKLEHQFIYIPIQGPDGKIWLNNNLGAEYANITSPYFNPLRQAGALAANGSPLTNPTANQIKRDFRAYGFLYEFGRDSDGHEVINWTSATNGTFSNQNLQNYNNYNVTYSRTNDPCPSGFHTPTKTELERLLNTIGNLGANFWNEKTLKLPAAGDRNSDSATLQYQGNAAWLWSSTENRNSSAWDLHFISSNSNLNHNYYRTHGHSVRCIAD